MHAVFNATKIFSIYVVPQPVAKLARGLQLILPSMATNLCKEYVAIMSLFSAQLTCLSHFIVTGGILDPAIRPGNH